LRYAELQVTSHFSFLRGASSAEELFAQAHARGIEALGVVDRNSLAGIVRAHEAAKTTGIRLVVACRLDLDDGMSILVYPTDRTAYSRLCRLLSIGKKRGGKAKCVLHWNDVMACSEGLVAVLVPDEADGLTALHLRRLRDAFPASAYLALTLRRRPNDQMRLYELSQMAQALGVPTVVTNDVLFHEPSRRMLQDVVTCIRHNVTIDQLGHGRERHADRYLKPVEEMHRLFARYPGALARTIEIADRCRFSLDELKYQYPEERDDPTISPQEALERLTWEGAERRYPEGVPDSVRAALRHELTLIEKLEYAPYFLTVNSIIRFARSQDILCQGRGSAANSAVCYVLGITSIDPGRNDLLFERFVSEERREPPDIDVDFEHERREIVMQWIFETYAQIVRDAVEHGVEVRPVCVNASRWDCTLEEMNDSRFAVRLGMRMVKGLANGHAARIASVRGDESFASIDDMWRRAGVPSHVLEQLAEADAFRPSLRVSRREALWAIKGLRDEPLPLFAAASAREQVTVPEQAEPATALRRMTEGSEVVSDYGHTGLSLRQHPVSFLRADLARRHIVTCAEATHARDGRWLEAAGLVLVRQRPGSAKGVMFITIEDESGIANLVVWPKMFEKFRRVVLGSTMFAVRGRIQREGDVVHLVAHQLTDMSEALAGIGRRDAPFPLPQGRGDELHHGSPTPDPRGAAKPRDIYIPDLHIDRLRVRAKNFR
jgi:DNA polymerase III alpha subunit